MPARLTVGPHGRWPTRTLSSRAVGRRGRPGALNKLPVRAALATQRNAKQQTCQRDQAGQNQQRNRPVHRHPPESQCHRRAQAQEDEGRRPGHDGKTLHLHLLPARLAGHGLVPTRQGQPPFAPSRHGLQAAMRTAKPKRTGQQGGRSAGGHGHCSLLAPASACASAAGIGVAILLIQPLFHGQGAGRLSGRQRRDLQHRKLCFQLRDGLRPPVSKAREPWAAGNVRHFQSVAVSGQR